MLANEDTRQYIKFLATGQEFATDIMGVKEIRGWTDTTAVPHAADYVRGVINLRGQVLPVIDLKARLGMGPTDATTSHVIMVLQNKERAVGVLVEAVLDIMTLGASDIQPMPEIVRENRNDYVEGMAVLDGKMVTLLGIDKLTAGVDDVAPEEAEEAPAEPEAEVA
jgi:purine-binding chemotaxis protein CheW